jgi:hypothetical protein
MLQISIDHKIITDERLVALTPFLRQWFISGSNELEFKKMADLRLFINGSTHKKQLDMSDLKFPSFSLDDRKNPMRLLKGCLEQECDYQTFMDNFVEFLQLEQGVNEPFNFTVSPHKSLFNLPCFRC